MDIKSVPFVERLVGTIRRELIDQALFWNATDLERKWMDFRHCYNTHRTQTALCGTTPAEIAENSHIRLADLSQFNWKPHCRGLYQLAVTV